VNKKFRRIIPAARFFSPTRAGGAPLSLASECGASLLSRAAGARYVLCPVTLLQGIQPGLLLAAPRLGDPNFEGTVVLLGAHDDDGGSIGWTVNGPEIDVAATIIRATGLVGPSERLPEGFDRRAARGGPVSPESVWILHRRTEGMEALPGTVEIGDAIGVTSTAEALAMLIAGQGPSDFRLLVGYAGWGPGQLAREMAQGAWLPAPADPVLLFEEPAMSLWRRAYEKTIGTGPGAFVAPGRGGGSN